MLVLKTKPCMCSVSGFQRDSEWLIRTVIVSSQTGWITVLMVELIHGLAFRFVKAGSLDRRGSGGSAKGSLPYQPVGSVLDCQGSDG
jgi:hypothetical protein